MPQVKAVPREGELLAETTQALLLEDLVLLALEIVEETLSMPTSIQVVAVELALLVEMRLGLLPETEATEFLTQLPVLRYSTAGVVELALVQDPLLEAQAAAALGGDKLHPRKMAQTV